MLQPPLEPPFAHSALDTSGPASRQGELRRLARDVQRIRAKIDSSGASMRQLLEAEQSRRLTAEEAARARTLSWEAEGLRHELLAVRDQFEQVVTQPA